jgi:CO/xanthine dehydrogenase FAD-binding subunit
MSEPVYLRPRTVAEAVQMRADNPDYLVLAGGTDLMVGAEQRSTPHGVIDVFALPELLGVVVGGDVVRIGAATTFAQLLSEPEIHLRVPALAAAAREIGALQIQARGTLGGNVGTSSPVGDTLPVLLAVDAEVELVSVRGRHRVAYRDFCTGYRTTGLAADELIAAIWVPARAGWRQFWRKVGTRRAQSISKVMLAAAARVDGGVIVDARVALGAVRERPVRADSVERALLGHVPSEQLAAQARRALAADIAPIDDMRSTARYRHAVASNLTARFVSWLATAGEVR